MMSKIRLKGGGVMNRFEYCDDYVVGYCNNGQTFKIDTDDLDLVSEYHWWRASKGIYTHTEYKSALPLSELIYLNHPELHVYSGCSKTKRFNGDSFDYRKSNLYFGNTYIFDGDRIVGRCFNGRTFCVNRSDFELIAPYRWHVDANQYVLAKIDGTEIKQHRLILGIQSDSPSIEVDHINHDTCDNRRSNLRIVNRSQNCINERTPLTNTSGRKGVYWSKPAQKWCAQINIDKRRIYLGSFESFNDACQARAEAEVKYHKEYACVS